MAYTWRFVEFSGYYSQRLIPGKIQKRVAAIEVMINTPYVAELIKNKNWVR